MKLNTFRRWSVAAALAMLALSPLAAPAAQAAPDDGKPVATQTHIDGPKAFWENGNFVLKTEGKFDGMPTSAKPMQDVVNWVGQGYSGRGDTPAQQFMFTVPGQGGEALAFLGAPGETWYQAPRLPVGNHDPIWIGLGADAGLPVDTFRDGTASIDLLSVDGPGKVEWVSSSESDGHWDVIRILSSTDPDRRSHKITAGSHGHMDTLFSKPGRYTMSYQASARLKDGTMVRSEPQQQVWQVGGNRPAASESQPLSEQYNQSVQGTPAVPYQLSYATAPGSATDARMDGKLTDITFSAAPEVAGTLTLFNDGYFHSEIPVSGGKATARELMGTAKSNVQGVFVPANGGTSAVPAYVLAAVEYQHGKTANLTSAGPAGSMPKPVPAPAPTVTFDKYTPTSLGYSASIKPLGDGRYQADVTFDDPNIRGFMGGGIFDAAEDVYPTIEFSGVTGPSYLSDVFSWEARFYGNHSKINVYPHPGTDVRAFTVELPDVMPATAPVIVRGVAEADVVGLAPKPTPTATATPTAAPSATPTTPADVCLPADGRVQLGRGHVDLKAVPAPGGELTMVLADETAQIDQHAVDRDPSDVALLVTSSAKSGRLAGQSGAEYDFLGPVGSTFYRLPQTQQSSIIWPGWNTMEVDYSKLEAGVQLQLRGVQAPEGGEVKVFTTDGFGKPSLLLDSAGTQKHIDVSYPTHTHADWIFTKAGTYDLTLAFAAKSKDGAPLDSTEHTLRVRVDPPAGTCPTDVNPGPVTSTTAPPVEVKEVVEVKEGVDGNEVNVGTEPQGSGELEAAGSQSKQGGGNGADRLAATGAETAVLAMGALLLLAIGGTLLLFRGRRRAH